MPSANPSAIWSRVPPEKSPASLNPPEAGSRCTSEKVSTLPGSDAAQFKIPEFPEEAAERLTVPESGVVVVGDVGVVVVVGVGATSSSVVVTVTTWSATGSKLSAELASITEKVTAVV